MALTWTRPSLPASNAALFYECKEAMKSAGWTVPRSSDGTTYNSSGDQVTSGAAFATTGAWFEMNAPDGSFAFVVQKGSANTTGRVKFAWGTSFSAGSPGATQTPATSSAADEITVLGGGTDAAPTYGTLIAGVGGNENPVIVADTSAPYGFFWISNRTTGADVVDMCFYFDPLLDESRDDLDTAPSVAYWSGSGIAASTNDMSSAVIGPVGWIGKGIGGGGIVRIPALNIRSTGSIAVPSGLNRSFYDSAAELFPVSYARLASAANPDGWKGISSLFCYPGSLETTGTRLTTVTEGDKWITGNDLAFPWDGTAMANDPSGGTTRNAHYRTLYIAGDSQTGAPPAALSASGRAPTRASGRRVRRVRQ